MKRIAVAGTGYVGLVAGVCFVRKGDGSFFDTFGERLSMDAGAIFVP